MTSLAQLYQDCSRFSRGSRVTGSLLGRYELELLLGVGGTSVVVSARDSALNRRVAVKLWNPAGSTFVSRRARRFSRRFFLREAELLAALAHPNLCEIHDFGVGVDQTPWMVMELFATETLDDRLGSWRRRRARHELSTILAIYRQVVASVCFLHSRQLWRLDVKPDNVLVLGSSAKVIDVGSCMGTGRPDREARPGVCGTAGYLAPETFLSTSSEQLTPAVDVFSLGILLLQMCCLENPLDCEELKRAAYDALGIRRAGGDETSPPAGPSTVRHVTERALRHARRVADIDYAAIVASADISLPASLVDLVARATRGVPDRRPSAHEILESISRIVNSMPAACS